MLLIALDVSTSCTGYTVFRRLPGQPEELLDMGFIKLGKYKNLFDKIARITEEIERIIADFDRRELLPLKFYCAVPLKRTGFGSINTITLLWMFHGMLSQAIMEDFNVELQAIKEGDARRTFGVAKDKKTGLLIKEAGRQFTMNDIKNYNYHMEWKFTRSGNPVGGTLDMTDAYIIAKYALTQC